MSMGSSSVNPSQMGTWTRKPLTAEPLSFADSYSQSTGSRSTESRPSRSCSSPDLCSHHAQGPAAGARLSVKLSNVSARGLPELSFFNLPHTFNLKIKLGGQSRTCQGTLAGFRDGAFHWDGPEYFTDVKGNANIDLEVWSDHNHDYGRTQSSLTSLRFDASGTHDEYGCLEHETRTWKAVFRKPLQGAAFYRQRGAEIVFTLSLTTIGTKGWLQRKCTVPLSSQESLLSEGSA
ncbi:hypothetical protein CONPUDRAFT_153688 [Coniophora puteana RWD-64-598 SS2]|uniref:Uncharacterized protein n=1 Tax=Coniophora puteana (strain RWD-64-598) TaxID=741705 RepID=A0A5M3MRG9_CONPW|nr:uncharacterized protein CONPUDRAFT_153688 [Coniophora puteana RWD-64-598 SS2]EIW81141.1 hypothetical protein CONPUDRAFT_153688 [Coniophora puteana RWD-64-598 SS2]